MVVTNPEHRKHAEEIWKLPEGLLPDWIGYHAVQQDRMLKDGELNFYWVQVNNNLQAAPNNSRRPIPVIAIPRTSSSYRTPIRRSPRMAADLILPTAMWVEKEGAYGNAERRTHFWHQLVNAPGEARSDLWQLMEFSKRFTTDEVWPSEILDANPDQRGQVPCSTCSSGTAMSTGSRSATSTRHTPTMRRSISASTSRRVCSRNTPHSGAAMVTTWRRSTAITRTAASAGRWSTGRRRCWRYREGHDPYVTPGAGVEFYGRPDKRAVILAVPYEPPAEAAGRGI